MPDRATRASSIAPAVHGEPTIVSDPLADLLLSVVAIVVIVMMAILPTLPRHPVRRAASPGELAGSMRGLPDNGRFRLHGHAVAPWVATAPGLVVGGASELIPVDRILQSDSLVARLEQMRRRDETMVLLIEPDGFDTAFQLEVVASAHGPQRMHQVRLDAACSHARSAAVARACGLAREAREPRP